MIWFNQTFSLATLPCLTCLYSSFVSFGHSATMCTTVSSTIPHNQHNGGTSSPNTVYLMFFFWTMLVLVLKKIDICCLFSNTPFSTNNPMIFCPLLHLLLFWTVHVVFFHEILLSVLFCVVFHNITSTNFCQYVFFWYCRYSPRIFTVIRTQSSTSIKPIPPLAPLKYNLSASDFRWCTQYILTASLFSNPTRLTLL